jgi:FHIPEP family
MIAKLATRFGGDIGIGVLIITVLALIIVPVPLFVIDALLAVNLMISALLLMVVMYVPGVVDLSTFPTLLLFTTMFRLALNIASTKVILLTAEAGHVIEAFGNLVVGGNVVVGFVVFVIITIVQFIVIAKGSERVAEVGARFTLDALPGKQMSIDADLRAGLITGEAARAPRPAGHGKRAARWHGRRDEVRQGRRHCRPGDHGHQHPGWHRYRLGVPGHDRRRGRDALHGAVHRRRHGVADSFAADLHGRRRAGDAGGRRAARGQVDLRRPGDR